MIVVVPKSSTVKSRLLTVRVTVFLLLGLLADVALTVIGPENWTGMSNVPLPLTLEVTAILPPPADCAAVMVTFG